LISEIEKTAPNLKALDQYEALREREGSHWRVWSSQKGGEANSWFLQWS
jgi:hypothetical protein